MFEPTSRYYHIKNARFITPEGRVIQYKQRRFLPQGESMPLQVELTAQLGDRLDLLAAQALGNALQFWRICDANNAMSPAELTAQPGRSIRVPIPQA